MKRGPISDPPHPVESSSRSRVRGALGNWRALKGSPDLQQVTAFHSVTHMVEFRNIAHTFGAGF